MFCSTNFPVCELQMAPGDSLFLYTDGLTEVFNSAGDEYGMKRAESLAQRHAGAHPEAMLTACLGEIKNFASGVKRTDDLTLLVLQRMNSHSA